MYNKKDIISNLFGLVGWRQNDNADFGNLNTALTESRSGLSFQDTHPLVQLEYIQEAFKNYTMFSYPVYAAGTRYVKGIFVTFNNVTYASLVADNIGNQPDTSPGAWEEVDPFSKLVRQITESSIDDVLTKIFTMKKWNQNTKAIFERVQIFDGVGNIRNLEIKTDRFVGLVIELFDHQNLSLILENIGLQLTEVQMLDIYLFHSSQLDSPVRQWTFNYQNANRFEWFSTDQNDSGLQQLKYYDRTKDAGGFWILGYYEEDLVGQAIIKDYDFGHGPGCRTCNRDYFYWENWSRFASYTPISVQSNDIAGKKPSQVDPVPLFDLEDLGRNYAYRNFGLNVDLTARCDLTDWISENEYLFVDPIRYEVARRLISELSMTTRNNETAKEIKELAIYEMNTKDNPSGFMGMYKGIMKGLNFDMSDLNDACLPCTDRWGVSTGKV